MRNPFRRRKRRADDGKFLAKDARAWRRLIKAARYAVRAPLAGPKPLAGAIAACGKAVPPPGHARRDSIFLALLAEARRAVSPTGAPGAALGDLAAACARALDDLAPPIGPPLRLDIYG